MEERILPKELEKNEGNLGINQQKDIQEKMNLESNSKQNKESLGDNEISQKIKQNDGSDVEQNDHDKSDDEDDKDSLNSSQSSSSSSSSSSSQSSSSSGEFDFEKIKQKAGQSSSTLPKWFLETNSSLNTYNEKVNQVKERLSDLGKGLQQFEEKRQDHVNQQKEDRRKYFEKKYGVEVKKPDDTEERFKSPFYRLNQYILQRILEFAEGDLISNILKMSRVSRKFLHLTTSNEFWQRVSYQYIGKSIVDLNAKHQRHYQKHQDSKKQSKQSVTSQCFNKGMYQKWCLHLHSELAVFQNSIRNYRQQNCPLVVEHSLRTNLIRGLRIVNEIFSAVVYNQNKNFRLYILLVDFLKDNYLKGSYCLWRLAQTQEENIRYDAFDALFSLLQLEPTESFKLNSIGSISHFLQESFFDMEKKLKALISTELCQILGLLPSRFKESTPNLIMLPSIIYNSRFSISQATLTDQHLQHQHYDLQDSSAQIKQIDQILKQLLVLQEGQEGLSISGYYMQRDNNVLQELKGKILLTKGSNNNKGNVSYQIKGYGITSAVMVNQMIQNQSLDDQISDQEQFQLEGAMIFNHKSVLKNNYEVHNQVAYFASGKMVFQLGAGRPGQNQNMFIHAGFSFPVESRKMKKRNDDNYYENDFQEDDININEDKQKDEEDRLLVTPTFTFYGGSENLREILLIRF